MDTDTAPGDAGSDRRAGPGDRARFLFWLSREAFRHFERVYLLSPQTVAHPTFERVQGGHPTRGRYLADMVHETTAHTARTGSGYGFRLLFVARHSKSPTKFPAV